MRININIAEDAELRAFVKEQIKGAVKSITREEIVALIVAETSKKTRNIESIFDAELRQQVKARIVGNSFTKSEMEVVLRDEISKALKSHFSRQ